MQLILIAFIAICLAGCAEITVYASPWAEGQIVDAKSNAPIEGACISIVEKPIAMTCSDKQGNFKLQSQLDKAQVAAFGPVDPIPPPGVAKVSARGYMTQKLNLHAGINDIVIRMEHEK